MAAFYIEINGDFEGNVSWNTRFLDRAENNSDANTDYIINIARELAKSLKQIQVANLQRNAQAEKE